MKLHWAMYALMTVVSWGLYGTLLNWGAAGFHHNRIKAFLFVGVAYFLVAVLVPLLILAISSDKDKFDFSSGGIIWSLIAGTAGAIGALTVLFALSLNQQSTGNPGPLAASQVMSLVFAGAPIVAAIFGLVMNPPKAGFASIDWRFVLGIVMAASGGALVTLFKP